MERSRLGGRLVGAGVALLPALLLVACSSSSSSTPSPEPAAAAHDDEHDHAHTHAPRRSVPEGAGAPLFDDLGDYSRPISSRSELAQRYFDQGLTLAWGFNHAEALRSFAEAWRQDPGCGICAWGEALVLGPNINKPMDPADAPRAWEALARARRVGGGNEVEQALIDALAARYAQEPPADRSGLDRAYADAMQAVAARFPDDLDVQTLYAEAVMDTMPWDYYVDPATPREETTELLATLERVMAADPEHVGALHLYIHAVEPSSAPGRGERAADRLRDLVPGAGHLVHMPAHIYLRVGRYYDASLANERAAEADETYITQCRAQGFYPAAYYPHNIHFLYASAAFEGRSAVSLGAARKLSANMTPAIVAEVPPVEEFVPISLYALARFGRWEEILQHDPPLETMRYTRGAWHYVLGMAHAALGQLDGARAELERVRAVAAEPALSEMVFPSGSTPAQLLEIGGLVLEARIAGEEGRWEDAVPLLERAVLAQEALPYTEPPPWYFPNREALGNALLRSGRPEVAEAVFRRQLRDTPRNGWSLHGLQQSLMAQGKGNEAADVQAELAEVWARADFALPAAVF